MQADAVIAGLSVFLASIVINASPVRSKLRRPAIRVVAAGLLAGVIALAGILIKRLAFNGP